MLSILPLLPSIKKRAAEVASEYVLAAGVSDRVGTLAIDMFRQDWPRDHDGILFSNVFHDWSLETCSWLAKRAHDALQDDGRIFVHEMLFDDDAAGPVAAAAFSIQMLIGTQGQQLTFAELAGLLTGAGFTDVQVRHSYGYYSVVSAKKQRC